MPPFDNNNSFSVSTDVSQFQTIAGSNSAIAAASAQVSNLIAPFQTQSDVENLIAVNKPGTLTLPLASGGGSLAYNTNNNTYEYQPPRMRFFMTGMFIQLFQDTGTGLTTPNRRTMVWTMNSTPGGASNRMHNVLIFPFRCTLTQITCRFLGDTPVQIGVNDSWRIECYKFNNNPETNVLLSNATQIGGTLIEWNISDHNSFPASSSTLASPIVISAGDQIGFVAVETVATTTLNPVNSEAQVGLVFEYD